MCHEAHIIMQVWKLCHENIIVSIILKIAENVWWRVVSVQEASDQHHHFGNHKPEVMFPNYAKILQEKLAYKEGVKEEIQNF